MLLAREIRYKSVSIMCVNNIRYLSSSSSSSSLNTHNARTSQLFISTPLLSQFSSRSFEVKNTANNDIDSIAFNVHYKMECFQPSGSFKDRGLGNMIEYHRRKKPITRLVSSSGGNAGYSATTIARRIGLPIDVFCPVTTSVMMQQKLRDRGAIVHVNGANWNAADAYAREYLNNQAGALYVPPFDDPLIWEGHATIIDELKNNPEVKPDVIIVSVGGGGLLRGVQIGVKRVGWADSVSILAVETAGAASFAAAVESGFPTKLSAITSIASSLGALQVIDSVLDKGTNTVSVVVDDKDAVTACWDFVHDQRVLVEPACGAALAALQPHIVPKWIEKIKYSRGDLTRPLRVVVVVCGGNNISVDMLSNWKVSFGLNTN